jgi:hypothetical protein
VNDLSNRAAATLIGKKILQVSEWGAIAALMAKSFQILYNWNFEAAVTIAQPQPPPPPSSKPSSTPTATRTTSTSNENNFEIVVYLWWLFRNTDKVLRHHTEELP